jgi:uncharacterized membrane protein
VEVPRQEHDTKKIAEINIPRRPRPIEETKKASEDRIVMLSDGIFAIAVTLLVLGIQIPPVSDKRAFLAALQGDFYANTRSYVVTFAVLAGYWLSHRRLMNVLTRVDRPFLWLNLLFLAFVAYFPVAASLLRNPYPEATIVYTVVLAGCGYSSLVLWIYALGKHRLVAANNDTRSSMDRVIGVAIMPTFFLASLLLLLIPQISSDKVFDSWLLLPLMNIVYIRIVKFSKKSKREV